MLFDAFFFWWLWDLFVRPFLFCLRLFFGFFLCFQGCFKGRACCPHSRFRAQWLGAFFSPVHFLISPPPTPPSHLSSSRSWHSCHAAPSVFVLCFTSKASQYSYICTNKASKLSWHLSNWHFWHSRQLLRCQFLCFCTSKCQCMYFWTSKCQCLYFCTSYFLAPPAPFSFL
jgi:hypothetical protein